MRRMSASACAGALHPFDVCPMYLQTSEQVGNEIWKAVAHRKREVSVGLPYQVMNVMYNNLNINPLSLGV